MEDLLAPARVTRRSTGLQVIQVIQIVIITKTSSGVPFIFLHVPFYVCILAPLVNITIGLFNTYLPYLFAWCPVLNPLIVFYFVADIRNYLIQKLKLICCFNKSPVRILEMTANNRK
uniref:G_PROTEIN_RECEP_F1_2 domain-containing protein n=1 Tax=Angiostrongylus cantonensis TaxID=6313 RepID=A0A0K0DKX6_ANGCA